MDLSSLQQWEYTSYPTPRPLVVPPPHSHTPSSRALVRCKNKYKDKETSKHHRLSWMHGIASSFMSIPMGLVSVKETHAYYPMPRPLVIPPTHFHQGDSEGSLLLPSPNVWVHKNKNKNHPNHILSWMNVIASSIISIPIGIF